MEKITPGLSLPAKMGIIIGLVYCILIFIENTYLYKNPPVFSVMKFLFYLVIMAGYFYTGWMERRELGGFITFQECLKAILVAIAVTELIYLIFSTIYIKYIDPAFLQKLKISTHDYLVKINVPEEDITNTLSKFNEAGKITVWSLIQTYGFSIIIDAVPGVIIALILKRPRLGSENSILQ